MQMLKTSAFPCPWIFSVMPLHGPSVISYLIPQSIILSSPLRDLNINAVRCEILMAVPMKYAVISLVALPNTLILS